MPLAKYMCLIHFGDIVHCKYNKVNVIHLPRKYAQVAPAGPAPTIATS